MSQVLEASVKFRQGLGKLLDPDHQFDEIWTEVAPGVYTYLRGLSPRLADDLLYETWLRARVDWEKNKKKNKSITYPRAWARSIAHSVYINVIRRNRPISETDVGNPQNVADFGGVCGGAEDTLGEGPEEAALAAERESIIAEAIAELSQTEQIVVRLRYFKEMKWSQVAEELEMSESWVKQLWKKARKSLEIRLRRYGGEEGAR